MPGAPLCRRLAGVAGRGCGHVMHRRLTSSGQLCPLCRPRPVTRRPEQRENCPKQADATGHCRAAGHARVFFAASSRRRLRPAARPARRADPIAYACAHRSGTEWRPARRCRRSGLRARVFRAHGPHALDAEQRASLGPGARPGPLGRLRCGPRRLTLSRWPQVKRHRVACHRCGNVRRSRTLCGRCPHSFCKRCVSASVSQHAPDPGPDTRSAQVHGQDGSGTRARHLPRRLSRVQGVMRAPACPLVSCVPLTHAPASCRRSCAAVPAATPRASPATALPSSTATRSAP